MICWCDEEKKQKNDTRLYLLEKTKSWKIVYGDHGEYINGGMKQRIPWPVLFTMKSNGIELLVLLVKELGGSLCSLRRSSFRDKLSFSIWSIKC